MDSFLLNISWVSLQCSGKCSTTQQKLKDFVDGVTVTNWVTVWLVLLTKRETALDVVETDLINRTIKIKMYNPDTRVMFCFLLLKK